MDLGLTGERALVMSSSRGLGLGAAEALAAEGAKLPITGSLIRVDGGAVTAV